MKTFTRKPVCFNSMTPRNDHQTMCELIVHDDQCIAHDDQWTVHHDHCNVHHDHCNVHDIKKFCSSLHDGLPIVSKDLHYLLELIQCQQNYEDDNVNIIQFFDQVKALQLECAKNEFDKLNADEKM